MRMIVLLRKMSKHSLMYWERFSRRHTKMNEIYADIICNLIYGNFLTQNKWKESSSKYLNEKIEKEE